MKIALVSLAAGAHYEKLAELANPARRAYCARHGYDFIYIPYQLDPTRPPAWSKILAVKMLLPNYDWVLWLDGDTVVWNNDGRIEDIIALCPNKDFIIQRNWEALNSGIFLARRCDWMFALLDAIYAMDQNIHDRWWENRALIDLLDTNPVLLERIHVFEWQQPSRGFHGYFHWEDRDKIFIHLANMGEHDRLVAFDRLIRGAEVLFARRLFHRNQFGEFLNDLGLRGEGVEVGVYAGDYSLHLLNTWEGCRLHLIDAWRHLSYRDITNDTDVEQQKRFESVQQRFSCFGERVQIHRSTSHEAVTRFANDSLDFVYLDACPTTLSVYADILAWYPRLKRGGIIAGHDFLDAPDHPCGSFGVKTAVEAAENVLGFRAAVTFEWEWPTWYAVKDAS